MADFADNGTVRGWIETINILNRITNINILDLKMEDTVLLTEQFAEGHAEIFERLRAS